MTAKERFDELVSSYLDESLDDDGVRELDSLLATKPEYAARFTAFSRLHAGLCELDGPLPEPPESRWSPRLLVAALVAAAIAAAVFLLLRR